MEGHLIPDGRRKVEFVKEQRAANRVFGLTEPEHWSGSKQLIDFLDELFNEKRSAQSKLSKPVCLLLILRILAYYLPASIHVI